MGQQQQQQQQKKKKKKERKKKKRKKGGGGGEGREATQLDARFTFGINSKRSETNGKNYWPRDSND